MKGNVGLLLTIVLTFAFVVATNLGMNKFYYKTGETKTYADHGFDAAKEVVIVGASYFVAGFLVNMI